MEKEGERDQRQGEIEEGETKEAGREKPLTQL